MLLFGSLIARYLEYARVNAQGGEKERKIVSCYWEHAVRTILWCALFFVVIPFIIYFASYTPYYIYESGQSTQYGLKDMFNTFWNYQNFMYNYHAHLKATHPYQSNWYSWPFTVKPMWYYFNSYTSATKISTLSASGNPAVWWVSTIGAVTLLLLRISRRIKPDRALQIFCVGVLANICRGVLVPRCTFIYHFLRPFRLFLWRRLCAAKAGTALPGRKLPQVGLVGFALLFFVLLYPGISGLPVSPEWARFFRNYPEVS